MVSPQIVPVGLLHPTGSSLDMTIQTEQKGKLYSNDVLFEHLYSHHYPSEIHLPPKVALKTAAF